MTGEGVLLLLEPLVGLLELEDLLALFLNLAKGRLGGLTLLFQLLLQGLALLSGFPGGIF